MKKYYIFLCMAIFAIAVSCTEDRYGTDKIIHDTAGNPYGISIDEARQMLLEIMDGMETTKSSVSLHRNISESYSVYRHSSGETKSGDEEPYIHIFNFDDESGFAIMSADRRVTPLLAYALSGNLEKDGEIDNPGLAIYMSKLEKYFEYITINDTTPKQQDTLYWGYIGPPEFSTMINGYCPVKWGQAYPYNYYCYLPDGEHAHTGCVATAVAQLMCTYRYPDKHLGYEFDWEEMINFDNSLPPAEADTLITIEPPDEGGGLIGMIDTTQNTTPEIDSAAIPIAWLMRQLGLPENLNMEYKPGASDAKMENIPRTLENFGYESGGEFIYNYLHPEQIQSRVREELASGYYCIMSGVSYEYKTESSPIDTIGMDSPEIDIAGHHCWLLHGLLKLRALLYDEEPHPANPKIEYYYLCNFGWDGYADGFYLSDVFDTKEGPKFSDPDTKSTEIDPDKRNFSYFLDYIVGIRK